MSLSITSADLAPTLDLRLQANLTTNEVEPGDTPDEAVIQEVAAAAWLEMQGYLGIRYVWPDDVPTTGPVRDILFRVMRYRLYLRNPQVMNDNPGVVFDYADPKTGVIALMERIAAGDANLDGMTEQTTGGDTVTDTDGITEGLGFVSQKRFFTSKNYQGV